MKLTGLRRAPTQVDAVVVGRGLPALATALELARRGASVSVVEADAPGEQTPELGLMLLGPGRPYLTVAKAIGRPAAQLLWAAGCENHLRLEAFLDQAARPCGYVARGSFLLARDRRDAEDLAESEDMLRDDGFPGEFLDHYMIETRFDVSGFPGAYWAAEDAEIDPLELASAVREAARDARVAFPTTRARALRAEAGSVVVTLEQGVAPRGRGRGGDGRHRGRAAAGARGVAAAPGAREGLARAPRGCDAAGRVANGRRANRVAVERGDAAARGDRARPPESGEDLLHFASRLPLETGTARVHEDVGEVSIDGLPVVGPSPA